MAPVYDFRHVELDKIGRGKRIVKPPGGECSDIFGPPEHNGHSTPRKTNNYMQSTIFSPDGCSSPPNGMISPSSPCKRPDDTQTRLFGGEDFDGTPRKIVDRQRSTIFEDEVDSGIFSPKSTPGRRGSMNPITGSPISENGTNGHSNGSTNGHSTPESPANGCVRVRNPPGGRSSGIF